MDSKEIKSLLKQAREAIKDKDYKGALKHCKAILNTDKDNYNAWVFIGAAAQEIDQPDQSEAAFRKAIEIAPDQLLAWQGLCKFYETSPADEKLLSVYKRLIELFSPDKEKQLEVYGKLIDLLKKQNDKEKLLKVLKSKLQLVSGDNCEELLVQKQIFEELSGKTKLVDWEKEMLNDALQHLVSQDTFTTDDCKRIFTNCIDLLFKAGLEQFAADLAQHLYQKFPHNLSCLEFLMRYAMNSYIESATLIPQFEEISQKMNDFGNSSLSVIFGGFCEFISKKYDSAIDKLNEGLKTMEFCIQGWYFLSKCQLNLHQYVDAERSSKKGIENALKSKAPSNLLGSLYLLLGQALCGRENWNSALKALEKCVTLMGQSKGGLITFAFTLLELEQISKAEQVYQELKEEFPNDAEVLQLEGYILLLKDKYEDALNSLRLSVSLAESAFTLHLIGLVLWQSQQKDKAFKIFFKAVELDPYFAKNFMYLGHYYRNNLSDNSKARLCYEKAFNLDPSNTEIAMSYSQVLQDLGQEDETIKVLKIITEKASSGSCRWAWTQLGLFQMKRNLPSDAIFSLQNALRADPNSSYGWECLADGYLKRGSYESALKAFEKVVELNPKAMYPLYQIAIIQKMRGMYSDAIMKFNDLISLVPTYVPALIGLSETLILAATKALSECLYGLTMDYCQETLHILGKVATLKPGLACLWKLAGDACTIPYHLHENWYPFKIPFELQQEIQQEYITCTKSELLEHGSKFYGRAILIKENLSTLWHDLGVNCQYQSLLCTGSDKCSTLAEKAFVCLQKAVSLSPGYEAHWNALGVIALSKGLGDCAFGQHAFIKSLQNNKLNAETWTNLGILYLEKENIQLAHMVFKIAQSAEPSYPYSWIGQAIIADKVKHSETLDLYKHASTLCSHNEALIGYSRSVCETLLGTSNKDSLSYKYNIEQMNAVVVGADCAVKFAANNCNSAEAFNVLGLLLERQGIYNASLQSFERALKLLESINNVESIEKVRSNYARLLSTVGYVKEAIKEYFLLKKFDTSTICCFAHALFKDEQYEQSFKLFSQVFEKSKNISDKSHLKVAMAIVADHMTGPNAPNPLALLLESAQLKPVSVPGLLALMANGIIKKEDKLISAAQKELQLFKFHKDYSSSVAFLSAAQTYATKGAKCARNDLLKFLHCSPADHRLWMLTARCLLHWDTDYAPSASYCAKVGVFHGGCLEEESQIFALCQMAIGYRKGVLSAAQKAVHINPGKLSNWAVLTAACHVADLDYKDVGWMFGFVRKLAKEQGVKADFLSWFIVMEIFHHINSGNMSVASALTKQILSLSSCNAESHSTLQVLDAIIKVFSNNGDLQPLFLTLKDNPKSFFAWDVLSQLLLSSENYSEAEKTISHFAVCAEKLFPKWVIYPLLQFAVLSYKAMHTCVDEKEKWLKLGEEFCRKATHLAPSNKVARFLQGLFALESGNASLVKRSFEKVLCSPTVSESNWMDNIASHILEKKSLQKV